MITILNIIGFDHLVSFPESRKLAEIMQMKQLAALKLNENNALSRLCLYICMCIGIFRPQLLHTQVHPFAECRCMQQLIYGFD